MMNGRPLTGCNFLNVNNAYFFENHLKYINNDYKAFQSSRLLITCEYRIV